MSRISDDEALGPDVKRATMRRHTMFGIGLSILLVACEARSMRIHLNISLFNYLDRPIFDVTMNGTDFMGASAHGFYGANGVIAMQPLTMGVQVVSWRLDGPEGMARNGETVMAKNKPLLEEVPKGVKWLGLHIYPDETVEISLSKGNPDDLQTERGKAIIKAWEAR